MAKIAILGTGAWGTALCNVLLENKHDIYMWGISKQETSDLKKGYNRKFFGNKKLNNQVKATTSIANIIKFAPEYVLLAIPSIHIVPTLNLFFNKLKTKPIYINVAKGFDPKTEETYWFTINKTVKHYSSGVVSLIGPSFATEVFNKQITIVNTVSKSLKVSKKVSKLFLCHYFKCIEITDVAGAETISALKNVMAIGSGILHAQHSSINTRSAMLAQIAIEISLIIKRVGGQTYTLYQYCGIGDVILTCTDSKSRNFSFGWEIGKYGFESIKKVLKSITVEGYWAAKIAYEIIKRNKIRAPMITHIYKILYCGEDATKFISRIIKEIR